MKKKVLIISRNGMEYSTEVVMDWIKYLGHDVERINGDVFESVEKSLMFGKESLRIDTNIFSNNYYSIWISKWSDFKHIENFISKCHSHKLNTNLVLKLANCFYQDIFATKNAFLSILKCKKYLTNRNQTTVNKIIVLEMAKRCLLKIPDFILTNDKIDLINFKNKKKNIILKDLGLFFSYYSKKNKSVFASYGEIINEETINNLPEFFFLSFFQEYIEKEYEIRTFFLKNKFYSMAIFSQKDPKTTVDFRRYNLEKNNRTVPYQLPKHIEKKIIKLMGDLNLVTGSIDILKAKNGKYYFLEVNPVGQFGMVSSSCNYNLELEVAKYLVA